MAYKFKPNKSVAKRLRLTATGKLKRNHSFTSHLMSARPSSKRRKLRRPAILFEGHSRNMRKLMGVAGIRPDKIRHERELAARSKSSVAKEATTAEKGK
jgi:large subunit ribosomal protein L35